MKTKKKRFNDNSAYFKWFNKNLGKINIIKLIINNDIIVYYGEGV